MSYDSSSASRILWTNHFRWSRVLMICTFVVGVGDFSPLTSLANLWRSDSTIARNLGLRMHVRGVEGSRDPRSSGVPYRPSVLGDTGLPDDALKGCVTEDQDELGLDKEQLLTNRRRGAYLDVGTARCCILRWPTLGYVGDVTSPRGGRCRPSRHLVEEGPRGRRRAQPPCPPDAPGASPTTMIFAGAGPCPIMQTRVRLRVQLAQGAAPRLRIAVRSLIRSC